MKDKAPIVSSGLTLPAASSVVLIYERASKTTVSAGAPARPESPPETRSGAEGSLLPASRSLAGGSRATLTLLTGVPEAGHVLAIGGTPITIGRAADADLVIDDPGVSDQHARVSQVPGGGFSILDLGSTSGTFLGAKQVAVALLRDGDLLRLGPRAQLRFAISDSIEESS